eukprot:CAMPEP_0201490220 /NCGR_PEP_ID=MMETSP0151_2-20130828/25606_1 /ASSEMBLY_ACC=CAM_ASM_000257 /TAXON_ID=200890 /ORGANISM="Paramoeba atlantica, Strain 621/1 / CCAP 1560/9" /LENGTH=32 /DNA_ID= /DNA_START= /DNA_END= /DNA_ORIENTATION=
MTRLLERLILDYDQIFEKAERKKEEDEVIGDL